MGSDLYWEEVHNPGSLDREVHFTRAEDDFFGKDILYHKRPPHVQKVFKCGYDAGWDACLNYLMEHIRPLKRKK
jgi:hypothetical protein